MLSWFYLVGKECLAAWLYVAVEWFYVQLVNVCVTDVYVHIGSRYIRQVEMSNSSNTLMHLVCGTR